MASEQSGGFFKVISSSLNMEIPESFVSEVGGSLGKRWILKVINCKPCAVEVYKEGTHHFLRRGWSDFYAHNSLQEGDVLVFETRANDLFNVKIFGHNGCKKGRRRPREDPIVKKEEEEEEEEEEEDIQTPIRTKTSTRPENPFFVSRSRTLARGNELYIPKDVIEDYHLKFSEKVILVDEQGMKWETKPKLWKDGRVWFTRGWMRLCRVNQIGPNETCICEFLREPGSELVKEIRVRRGSTMFD